MSADLLMRVPALAEALAGPQPPLVIDIRPAEEFARGHIPTAVHLDLWGMSLIDTHEGPLRAFMWMIAHLFSHRGVRPDRSVVVYDETTGMRAARAFWFLETLGHPSVRVLDGGSTAWVREGQALTTDAQAPVPSEWHGTIDPTKSATWREVYDRLGRADTAILDTRSDEEFYGTLVRAARGGAIPGAVHLEWTHNLAPDGRFKPVASLRSQYADAGVSPEQHVITYCQGGYRGAHAYLALRVLDYPHVQTYTGSWKEWGDRLDLPLERPVRPRD